jgi:16S rRNA (cytidine1402-2'-O)-methyltransferase
VPQELNDHFGADRRVVIGRELTKRFEEILRGTASSLLAELGSRSIRGEFTVIVDGK